MRKNIRIFLMLCLLLTLTGCGVKDTGNDTEKDSGSGITPTTKPELTIPTEIPEDVRKEVSEYFPFLENVEYYYEGEGNEFAAFHVVTDFINADKNRVQMRTNNGGSEIVRVFEIKDGKLSVILTKAECYYRDDFTDTEYVDEEAEIALMEPLVEGTEWTLADGRIRYISDMEVKVDTPMGSYEALEVTTKDSDSQVMHYYVPEIGLIKSVFQSNNYEVTSTLSEIKSDAKWPGFIEFSYPNFDENIYTEQKTLEFSTNEPTASVFETAMKEAGDREGSFPLISQNTKINWLYLGDDNIVYVDFSSELINEMNAGAGYELLTVQSIVNTLGAYYGTEEVLITVEQKPYESGHILLKEGETFKVNKEPSLQ
ncbi:GerMN domain-containing protein [Mobilitalea sibirica]|uniref:GerMN domain-containing protein n=1 Tax=Mobilitalea sibirica TaxID=1462919 RepID=A0A8J7H288_9FIRM|nr:GerMN domain-containing protein [Mobilitalea sibirica]MBH1940829.1 GerMN domain-containing protein [Mobilitalea sibirica]